MRRETVLSSEAVPLAGFLPLSCRAISCLSLTLGLEGADKGFLWYCLFWEAWPLITRGVPVAVTPVWACG